MTNKKKYILITLFLFIVFNLTALDLNFRPRGFVSFPSDDVKSEYGNAMYGTGGGGELGFEVDLSSVWSNPIGLGYTLGVEGGMLVTPIHGDKDKSAAFYSIGAAAGLNFFPMSRLFTRVDGAIGFYLPGFDGKTGDYGIYWRGGGEIGFRITPGFTVAANGGLRQYQSTDGGIFNSGVYAGFTAQLSFQTGKNANSESVGVVLDQYEAVYPAFMQMYQTGAIGALVIRNNENAEIRDVRVSFRALGYTSSEFPCGHLSIIPRGRGVQLPLLADFSKEVLRFTDKGRILGEVVIRYRLLGKEKESVRSVILATNNRNMFTDDAAALAAFISPTSPDVLDFGKYIAGLARPDRRTGHNNNLQYAIWLLEGLRAGGIILGSTYSDKTEAQFPAETLAFRSGNARDLALLFAGCLESVGISSAFVQVENDFLVAVSMNADASAAETLFNGTGKILIIDNKAWLPLSMAAFNEGFLSAWARAVKVLGDGFKAGKHADFVMVEEAWAVYPPAPFPEQGGRAVRTDVNAAGKEVNRAMQQYIAQEIQPVLAQIQAKASANPSATIINRLAIVQVRAGKLAEGKANYEKAAGMGSVPAMTNRGNLAMIEKDYATAEKWFKQALAKDSKNSAALRGLEQIAESR
jgi:hypothetical protein